MLSLGDTWQYLEMCWVAHQGGDCWHLVGGCWLWPHQKAGELAPDISSVRWGSPGVGKWKVYPVLCGLELPLPHSLSSPVNRERQKENPSKWGRVYQLSSRHLL